MRSVSKVFFFEKKNQKTFVGLGARCGEAHLIDKSFCFFFQKKAFLAAAQHHAERVTKFLASALPAPRSRLPFSRFICHSFMSTPHGEPANLAF
jgi:hypothetical protein